MWTVEQENALKHLFRAFDENKIRWMVFRNFEGLPEKNTSKDVDLLVKREDIPKACKVLCQTMKECGYARMTYDRFQCIWCYSFFKEIVGKCDSIKIDLFYGQVWRGIPTVSFNQIYSTAVNYNGFKVPNPVMDAFLLWIKPIMTGGKVKEKYIPQILSYGKTEKFQELIKDTFGYGFQQKVSGLFETKEDILSTKKYKEEMRKISWRKGFIKKPIDGISACFMHYFLEVIRRFHRPKGTVICVLGPDGVGKSTVIDMLKEKATDAFIRDEDKLEIIHFRPNILPNIKKLLSRNYDESKEEFTNPHRAKPAGKVSSCIRLAYYWLDYWLGKGMLRKKCINGQIIIFDRYSYDFIVDPRRTRISLNSKIIEFFMQKVPTPDKVFVLSAPAEVIYSRKKELEIDEIERQLLEYERLCKATNLFVKIEATKSPEEISDIILNKWIQTLDKV